MMSTRTINSLAGPSRILQQRILGTPHVSTRSMIGIRAIHQSQYMIPRRDVSRSIPSLTVTKPSSHSQPFRLASTSTATAIKSDPHTSPSSASDPQTSSSFSSESESEPGPTPEEPKSAYAKFKALSKKYGWWAVGMYFALSTVDFSLTFLLVHTFGADKIEPLIGGAMHQFRVIRHGEEETSRIEAAAVAEKEEHAREDALAKASGVESKKGSGGWGSRTLWAEIGLAYAIHKTLLLPVRAGITVAWTPKFVNWLASRGWVGKGGITRAASHAQGKIKTASDRVRRKPAGATTD